MAVEKGMAMAVVLAVASGDSDGKGPDESINERQNDINSDGNCDDGGNGGVIDKSNGGWQVGELHTTSGVIPGRPFVSPPRSSWFESICSWHKGIR